MADEIDVLTSDECACGCNSPVTPIEGPGNPVDDIIVRAKPGIGYKFNEFNEGGKKVFELDEDILVKPVLALMNDAGTIEVGVTVADVLFSGSIADGTYPVILRSISPDPGGLDLTAPFTFHVLNVKRTSPGVASAYTLSATDDQGNSNNLTVGVPVKDAYYQGFNELNILDQTQIKALANKNLVDNILQPYGGKKTYIVPNATPKYVYWAGSIDSSAPTQAILNGLPLPLTALANVVVTNPNDGSITKTYWVVRTTNRFNPGTYEITLL